MNAATSGQWRPFAERLAHRFKAVAVDAHGARKSPDWPPGSRGSLAEEIALLEPLLEKLDKPLHLVGHSYGAAIALKLALERAGSVASLAVYEPTLFSLLLLDGRRIVAGVSADRQPAIAQSMRPTRHWANALFSEPTPLGAFQRLDVPVLYMVGAR